MAMAGLVRPRRLIARAMPRKRPMTTTTATTAPTITAVELALLAVEDDSAAGMARYSCSAMDARRAGGSESFVTRARMLALVHVTALRLEPFGAVPHITSWEPGIAGSATSDSGEELVAPPQNETAPAPAAPLISSATRGPLPDARTRMTNTLLVVVDGSYQPSAAVSMVRPVEPMAACSTRCMESTVLFMASLETGSQPGRGSAMM